MEDEAVECVGPFNLFDYMHARLTSKTCIVNVINPFTS